MCEDQYVEYRYLSGDHLQTAATLWYRPCVHLYLSSNRTHAGFQLSADLFNLHYILARSSKNISIHSNLYPCWAVLSPISKLISTWNTSRLCLAHSDWWMAPDLGAKCRGRHGLFWPWKKAFNTVPHRHLLNQPANMGFDSHIYPPVPGEYMNIFKVHPCNKINFKT